MISIKKHARKYILFILLSTTVSLPLITGCRNHFFSDTQKTNTLFYVRYDVKSQIHTLSEENLIMVPAKDEFRKKNFSYISIPCVISMTPKESKNDQHLRAKYHALKTILLSRGLKSIFSKNLTTIISYEGFVHPPIQIKNMKLQDTHFLSYVADVSFCPVAFPDEWKRLKNWFVIEKKLHDFLSLFH